MNQTKQQVFLNSCELVLEEYSIDQKGFIYFIWKKGKKHIQSLKYPCSSDATSIKQNLTLSLKTYAIDGILQKKDTHFIMFDGDGQQLGKIKLDISEWKSQSTIKIITLGKCRLKMKVKRKVALELENFHKHARAEIQESSDQSQQQPVTSQKKALRKEELTAKEELAKAKRQIQDLNFLTNKVKNDRNFYIAQNQSLRNRLDVIDQEHQDQINQIKQNNQNRIQIRQSIYEQEIQQLISTFNTNYEVNRDLMQNLIRQKYDYQREIAQIKEVHQRYIQKQEEDYEVVIAELQENKDHLNLEIKDYLNKIQEKESTIEECKQEIEDVRLTLSQAKLQMNQQVEEHTKQFQKLNKLIEQKQSEIFNLKEQIRNLTDDLQTSNFHVNDLRTSVEQFKKMMEQFQKVKTEMQTTNSDLNSEKYQLQVQIEKNNVIIEELKATNEYSLASIQQLKSQDKLKEEEFTSQYKSMEQMYVQKSEMHEKELKAEHEKFLEINKENYELNLKIQKLENEYTIAEDQISMLKSDQEQNAQIHEQLRKEIKQQADTFATQYRDYNEQITDLMSQNNAFQAKNLSMMEQIKDLQTKLDSQTVNLKKDYEQIMESKIKFYQDQMDFLKKQRDGDLQSFEKMKADYEEQITSLINRESTENEQLQKMFKDQMEIKNKEYIELRERNRLMEQNYQDLKIRLQIAEENPQVTGRIKKKKRNNKDLSLIEQDSRELCVEEIESEEDFDQSESQEESEEEEQQQEDSEEIIQKKSKGKKPKPVKTLKATFKASKPKNENGKDKLKKKNQKQFSEQEASMEISQDNFEEQEQMIIAMDDDDFKPTKKVLKKSVEGKKFAKKKTPHILQEDSLVIASSEQDQKKVNIGKVISINVPDMPEGGYYQVDQDQQKSQGKKKPPVLNKNTSPLESDDQDNQKVNSLENLKELEKQIKQLKKQNKSLKRDQQLKLIQIEELQDEVSDLNKQREALIKKVAKKDPKLARKIQTEISQKRQQEQQNKIRRSDHSIKIPTPKKQLETIKIQNDYLKTAMEEKNRVIYTVQAENALLKQKLLKHQRATLVQNDTQNQKMYQSGHHKQENTPTTQYNVHNHHTHQPNVPSYQQQDQGLRKSLYQLEDKFMTEKEKTQQIKLQMNQLAFEKSQLQNQNKKLVIQLEQLSKNNKLNQPTSSMRDMQRELEEQNRQILEISKSLNSAKLQRDNFQEQTRLLKKRYADILRGSQQAQNKASNLQRQTDELHRKQIKSRREVEQYQEQIRRHKQQIKQLRQEINSLNTFQSQSVYERKKILDDVNKAQDIIANKQHQIIKLQKQIQRQKQKIQDAQDIKLGKRNQLLAERERLDSLVIKCEKRIQQLQQQAVVLKKRIEILDRQNKQNMDEKKQSYGEKLKFYIEEISSIKQIVDEYQEENSRLKIQNSEFFEHNQILKISYEKLESKYDQAIQNQENMLAEIDRIQKQFEELSESANKKQQQAENSQAINSVLRKELDNERDFSKKKSDKLQSYEQLNEKYLYEIKNLKVKLSEYDTNINEKQILTEKCQKSSKMIEELERELNKWQQDYNKVVSVYTYKKQDVELAMRQLKEHQQKVKEQQISKVIQELDSTYSSKTASMQQQIIQLFNENSKLRLSVQQKVDEISEHQLKIVQMDLLSDKVKSLQKERDNFQKINYQIEEQLKSKTEQFRRIEAKLYQSIRNQEGKGTQNAILSKKVEDSQRKYKDINEQYLLLKKQMKKILEKLKFAMDQKQQIQDNLNNDIQQYQNKILALELETTRLKQNLSSTSKQHGKRVKILQGKIEQMGQTFKQHEQTLENHYVNEINRLEDTVEKMSENLQIKNQRIDQLNQALIMIQQQNDDLIGELTSTRTQLAEQNEIYTNQVNNLRNQFKQAEDTYDVNIKALEEEMSALSKQLTALKYNRQSNSRLSGSSVDERSAKRTDQKIKQKDKKIEDLKASVIMMEETITKLMKNSSNQNNETIEKLKVALKTTEQSFTEQQEKYQSQVQSYSDSVKNLKIDILEWRNKNEQKQLLIQEKALQMQSMQVQLSTVKQLYSQLQKQLEKRKSHLNNQIQEQSHLQSELRLKTSRNIQLSERLQEAICQKNKIQGELRRKTHELKKVSQKLAEIQINYKENCSSQERRNSQLRNCKLQIEQLEEKLSKEKHQTKKLRVQMSVWQKENFQLKEQTEHKQSLIKELTQTNQKIYRNSSEAQALANKFNQLDNHLQEHLGIGLQQIADTNFWNRKLDEKDNDIQLIAEELEEIRFLYDRQTLEYDDLKKINYELSMKTEDNQFVYQQMETMRKMCDRLQNEKKEAIFREQALKIQLQNLLECQNKSDITEKLETILQGQYS